MKKDLRIESSMDTLPYDLLYEVFRRTRLQDYPVLREVFGKKYLEVVRDILRDPVAPSYLSRIHTLPSHPPYLGKEITLEDAVSLVSSLREAATSCGMGLEAYVYQLYSLKGWSNKFIKTRMGAVVMASRGINIPDKVFLKQTWHSDETNLAFSRLKPYRIGQVTESLITEEVARWFVSRKENVFYFLPDRWKGDVDLVRYASTWCRDVYQKSRKPASEDLSLAKEMFALNEENISGLGGGLRNSVSAMKWFLLRRPDFLSRCGHIVRGDLSLAQNTVRIYPRQFMYVASPAKSDLNLVKEAWKFKHVMLGYAGSDLTSSREAMEWFVQRDPDALRYCSASLRDSDEFVAMAVAAHPSSIRYASPRLRKV